MDCKLTRRNILAGLATACCCTSPLHAASLDTVPLYPDDSHSIYRVRMTMDVEGNAEVPKNEITADGVRKLPVNAESVIDYEERLFRNDDGLPRAAARYYYEAKTEGKVQKSDTVSGLRSEARRATLRVVDSRSVLFADDTQLTDEELQLLRVPVNSLAIDRLLPYKSLKNGDTWNIADNVLAELFDMDAIQKSSVAASLLSFDDQVAKMQLTGTISAAVDGVPTSIVLRGKMTFDRKQRAITWFAVALREDREIGRAEPGFEVAAQIRVIRQALPKQTAIHQDQVIDLSTDLAGDKLMIDVQSQQGGFAVYCDRTWRVMNASQNVTMMRMIDNDKVIAQCDVRSMPSLKDGHQLTLEAFQEDIQRTLADRFGEFLEAETKVTSHGVRLIRVVAQGAVQDIPVQWIYMHFSNDDGRRSAAIFTLADKQIEKFAGAEMQFAEGFRFIELAKESDQAAKKVAQAAAPVK